MKIVCQNLLCPKNHEEIEIGEECPICNVAWGTRGCEHMPWSEELKGLIVCPYCGGDRLIDPKVLYFLRVDRIKNLGEEMQRSQKSAEEFADYAFSPRSES